MISWNIQAPYLTYLWFSSHHTSIAVHTVIAAVIVVNFVSDSCRSLCVLPGLLQGQRTGAMWLVAGPGQNDEGRSKWSPGTKEHSFSFILLMNKSKSVSRQKKKKTLSIPSLFFASMVSSNSLSHPCVSALIQTSQSHDSKLKRMTCSFVVFSCAINAF